MKRLFIFCLAFSFIMFFRPLFAAEQAVNTEISPKAAGPSILDKLGDWFATFGKSVEEKAKILQERQEKINAEQTAKEIEAYQEKAQSEVQKAQEKAAQEIATAEEKAKKIEEQAREKAAEKVAAAKEKAQKEVEQAKENVGKEVEAYKEKLKKGVEDSLDQAKDLLKNWK